MEFRPEGCIYDSISNQRYLSSIEGLTAAMEKGVILEAKAVLCTSCHELIIDLPCGKGIIPREEGVIGISEGKTRDIALISRVNKIVCFKVTGISQSEMGEYYYKLSRKAAQIECQRQYTSKLKPGDIIDARISHMEKFGSFVDIGCGIPSLVPIDTMSVSRISHPNDRFRINQIIKVIVKSIENDRIYLTHKELLGTWEENACKYKSGETVPGVVRSIESYGVFVELAPNLAGLAEPREGISVGQSVSVYIKAIIPEKMKIKLIIVDVCGEHTTPEEIEYFIDSEHINHWKYSTENSDKNIETFF